MKTAVAVAWRFLTFSKIQTLFIVTGIAVGVAVQMFVGLLIDSLQANLIDRTVGASPHIVIKAKEQGDLVRNPEELILTIKSTIDSLSIAEQVADGNMVAIGPAENYPVLLRGIERSGTDLFQVKKNLKQGTFIRSSREVVVGSALAEKLNTGPNQRVTVADASGLKSDYRVAGIFTSGISAIDETWIVGDIRLVQGLLGYDKDATAVVLQVKDVFAVAKTKAEILPLVDLNAYSVTTWQEENAQLLSALSSQSSSSFMIQFFVLLSVTIAISSILSVTVVQKSRQIGILKAMGLTDRQTLVIFLVMSAAMGVAGATLGSFLGFGLFYGFASGPKNPDGSPIFSPVVRWVFVLATWLITVTSALVAGYFPARRSAKMSPVEIIQNG
jgi:lipoprotein-releasing system permease protein